MGTVSRLALSTTPFIYLCDWNSLYSQYTLPPLALVLSQTKTLILIGRCTGASLFITNIEEWRLPLPVSPGPSKHKNLVEIHHDSVYLYLYSILLFLTEPCSHGQGQARRSCESVL